LADANSLLLAMDRRGGEPWTRVLIFFWSPAAEDDEMSTASQQTPAPLSPPRTDQDLPPATTHPQTPPRGRNKIIKSWHTLKTRAKRKADACQVR